MGNNVRDYKRYVAKSMCLVDIRQKGERQVYKARKEVLDDLQLIVTNCYAYNTARGINLHMEQDARMLLEKGKAILQQNDEALASFEAREI